MQTGGLWPQCGPRDDALRDTLFPADTGRCRFHPPRRLSMQWTTPVATDLRFGFEITMYVAAR